MCSTGSTCRLPQPLQIITLLACADPHPKTSLPEEVPFLPSARELRQPWRAAFPGAAAECSQHCTALCCFPVRATWAAGLGLQTTESVAKAATPVCGMQGMHRQHNACTDPTAGGECMQQLAVSFTHTNHAPELTWAVCRLFCCHLHEQSNLLAFGERVACPDS